MPEGSMKFQAGQADDYTKQVGMTLSEIAYADPANIPRQLAEKYSARGGVYQLQWLGVTAGNLMYVCRQPGVDQWIVVIRGSASDPLTEAFWVNWFLQDLTVFDQVPLPFGQRHNGGARISWGAREGLEDLISMRDRTTGLSLVEFLQAAVKFTPGSVVVAGHSLGGALASVLAPSLSETLGRPNNHPANAFLALTFAAPTAGDARFASYLSGLFDGYPFRFVNSLDIAPHCWSLAGLDWITRSYQPKPLISAFFRGLIDTIWFALYEENLHYVQPGAGVFDSAGLAQEYWWFKEAGHQHAGQTYLKMYGAPQVIFPVPPASPVPARAARPRPSIEAR